MGVFRIVSLWKEGWEEEEEEECIQNRMRAGRELITRCNCCNWRGQHNSLMPLRMASLAIGLAHPDHKPPHLNGTKLSLSSFHFQYHFNSPPPTYPHKSWGPWHVDEL